MRAHLGRAYKVRSEARRYRQGVSNPPDDTPRLSRDRIVCAALAVIDAEGPAALTMRRLAAELGAPPMSLYRHIASRDDLLDAVVRYLMEGIGPLPDADGWEAGLRAWAAGYRAMALAHPRALPLIAARPVTGYLVRGGDVERGLGRFQDAGADPAEAERLLRGALALISGFCLLEAPDALADPDAAATLRADGFPRVADMVSRTSADGGEGLFALAVDLVMEGVRRRLTAAPDAPPTAGR